MVSLQCPGAPLLSMCRATGDACDEKSYHHMHVAATEVYACQACVQSCEREVWEGRTARHAIVVPNNFADQLGMM